MIIPSDQKYVLLYAMCSLPGSSQAAQRNGLGQRCSVRMLVFALYRNHEILHLDVKVAQCSFTMKIAATISDQ